MRHERNIKAEPKKSWRLNKTLDRKLDFRRMDDEDLRYVWAAYKKGALAPMAAPFDQTEMDKESFKQAFGERLLVRYDIEWTLLADTPRGFIPVGMVLAFNGHKDASISPFFVIGDIIWFPWATRRNIVESAVNFFNVARREASFIDYAHGPTNRRFFEMLAQHGIMRRVGTTYSIVRNEPVAIFETRSPNA
jgi:hypothetical protein